MLPPSPPRSGVWAAADAATAAALATGESEFPSPKKLAPSPPPLSIRSSFSASSAVLLTGAAGYVGSVVLEHLLRATPCPVVYVLVRPKKGVPAATRIDKLLTRPLFAAVHAPGTAAPSAATRARVVVVEGDLQAEALGLSVGDWAMLTGAGVGAGAGPSPPRPGAGARAAPPPPNPLSCAGAPGGRAVAGGGGGTTTPPPKYPVTAPVTTPSSITHIIHCAASISFTAPIQALLSQNYGATAGVLALAAACTRLAAFVHVSTAYVQAHLARGSLAREELARVDLGRGDNHVSLAARLATAVGPAAAEDAAAVALAATGLPNTYCLTKHLAECLVADAAASAPYGVSIVRPTIVASISQHAHAPAAVGYVGNAAGFTSVFLAYALGLVMYTCHRPDSIFDLVPGDVAAGVVLAAGAAAAEQAVGGGQAGSLPLIFHAASSTTNPITLIDLMLAVHLFVESHKPPLRFALRYPGTRLATVHRRFMAEASLRFKALNALTAAKFGLIRSALRVAGKDGLAAKVVEGRQAWGLYAGGRMDFDLRFGVASTAALAARLPAGEAPDFHCLWRAEVEGDQWAPYLDAYFKGITERHFPGAGAAAPAPGNGRKGKGGGKAAAAKPPTPGPPAPPKPTKPVQAILKAALAKAAVAPVGAPGGGGGGGRGGAPVAAANNNKVGAAADAPATLVAKAGRMLARPRSALTARRTEE